MTGRQYIPEEKQQAIGREQAKYAVRPMVGSDGRPDVSTWAGCVVRPLGFILDAWINPPANLIVDDCDLCSEIVPANDYGEPVEEITGPAIYAGYIRRIWGHFLMNTTARLWYMLKGAPSDAKIVFAVAEDENTGFWETGNYAELFDMLGIAGRIVVISRPTAFRSIAVPALGFNLQTHISPEWREIFDRLRQEALTRTAPDANSPKKIFFSRSAWKTHIAKDIGIELLDNYFARNGYAVISPEKMSLSAMIRLLDSAEAIAFTSGSVAHNILLAREGTFVTIVESLPTQKIFQVAANLASGISPVYIEGSLAVRPVEEGSGPCLYHYTDFWQKYTEDTGGCHPDEKYLSDRAVKRRLRTFFRSYSRLYKKAISYDMYLLDEADLYFRALERSKEALRPWLNGERALYFSDYLDPYFWARRIKRFFRRR